MSYKKTYKVVPTRDAFEVVQNVTDAVIARCASRVRAERVKDELNGCDVLPYVVPRALVAEAVEAVSSGDHDIAIGEHAFAAGYNIGQTDADDKRFDLVKRWSEYTPPEELCGGGA